MKKIIIVLLSANLNGNTYLLSQDKDSLAKKEEIQRFNRLKDSLYQAGLARDSALQEQMKESIRKAQQTRAEDRAWELAQATKEVTARQEKAQRTKNKTTLWAVIAFSLTIAITTIIANRRRKKNRSFDH